MSRFVYADNAATTPITEPVLRAMMPYLTESYGNPSSMYSKGREAKRAIELARESIAECIGARPGEIYFTAGGSESDNWALKGIARELLQQGKKHLITTCFEHHAVLHAAEALEREGFSVTYLPVHENGLTRPEEVANAIREDTALVSVMYANNEIGTIQPIAEIGAICHERSVLFHTDAVQAVGILPIDVAEQNIDLLSLSGHKLHAPKGIGALYVRRGITIQNLVDGGAQERGRRAGTENVAAIVGLAAAMRDACTTMKERAEKLRILRDRLIEGTLQIPGSSLNGDANQRLPGNVNFCLDGVDGEAMLLLLDRQGICASSGSACTAGSLEASHVLLAIGIPPELAKSSLRLTLGDQNTEEDVEYILSVLPAVIERLRTS